jgi:hypothetical protein
MEKINLISVNMGYGHQRTAYPLKSLAYGGEAIQANDYPGIPEKDRKMWKRARMFYEAVSRFKRVPLVGEFAFFLFDQFQKIFSFYPKRDLSKPNFQLRQIFLFIKKGWGRDLVEKCKERGGSLPFVSTFFTSAFMAEVFNYPGEIFCVVCDADIARTWAPLNPRKSRIKYFAPNVRVVERLKLYGVKESNIFLTGYPLPPELTGGEELEVLKENLRSRLLNLDPKGKYCRYYEPLIKKHLGKMPEESGRPLTVMFAVGGAGAQKEIGVKIVKALAQEIKSGRIKIILVAGTRKKIREYFKEHTRGLDVEIVFEEKVEDYFRSFNLALRRTDVLWTKPSELSFYSALGLPIIIAPPIGSQEEFNKRWLLKSGFGLSQENPSHVRQWLFDWVEHGYLAEAAIQGFIEGEKSGTLKIKKICLG